MKICVGMRSRAGGNEPSRLCLGRASLPVAAILDCHDEGGARLITVRVVDGRCFALRQRMDQGWDLIAAYGRAARRSAPMRQPLLALLLVAAWRQAMQLVRRAGRWRVGHPGAPRRGAPA
jgi:hypothetical protein